MSRIKKSAKTGMSPGSLVYVGDEQEEETFISIVNYDDEVVSVTEPADIDDCLTCKDQLNVTWVDICGLKNTKTIAEIGKIYNIHPLTIEDILNTEQRPKIDVFDGYASLIMRVYFYDEKIKKLKSHQISLILGKNFVMSFRVAPSFVFDTVKTHLQNAHNLMRKRGPDHLAHALMDVVVDSYYKVIESIGDVMEQIEAKLVLNPAPEVLREINGLKREVIFLRKVAWPLREVIGGMYHKITPLVQDAEGLYFKDIYDHIVQVIDTIETYRDLLSGMTDIYISSINNRLNEVMKVLTIFATIFIPLTFITSLYGMNFSTAASPYNMPELDWRYGYFFALAIMVAVVITMLLFFRRKKWI